MKIELENIIKYDSEGPNLDFKQEQYPLGKEIRKYEILKDFSAFANHHSDSDKFIIIGVKEINGMANQIFEIEDLIDEAKYQQFINEHIEPKINFEYKSLIYEEKNIAYFRIYGNTNRPYLFKGDLQNPISKKLEYKAGDGFIKIGSSTKKLQRIDFENIYKRRFSEIDRKVDLFIENYFGKSDNDEIQAFDVDVLDIDITNTSNKSIHFEIEIKIFKEEAYVLISEDDFINEMDNIRRRKTPGNIYGFSMANPRSMNMHINFKEYDDYIFVSRSGLVGSTGVSISQNSSEKGVFLKSILVIENTEMSEIKAELTIRSDDFTEGQLTKQLIFKK